MGIVLMFLLIATVAPFVFIHLKKTKLAIAQTILLVGMWLYFFEAMFMVAPTAFSITWVMFYLSLVVAEVAWVMFIIHVANSQAKYQESYQ
ncbi:hypothetical protein MUO14_10730 [Halobacillus shinanisalinarum]|uniref:Uncharacterized protein n=1 Tax=Halobacillus shinanisalinarum TaxID=2932258 RepID=A0ABY4H704_9BACI|nr:hypothetical protein [Halobacillus shinanisalinarum]UOQ95357.1 hypothetical protein MUO14_10730 [Halobacillus shinanisalinarum]